MAFQSPLLNLFPSLCVINRGRSKNCAFINRKYLSVKFFLYRKRWLNFLLVQDGVIRDKVGFQQFNLTFQWTFFLSSYQCWFGFSYVHAGSLSSACFRGNSSKWGIIMIALPVGGCCWYKRTVLWHKRDFFRLAEGEKQKEEGGEL